MIGRTATTSSLMCKQQIAPDPNTEYACAQTFRNIGCTRYRLMLEACVVTGRERPYI